MNIIDEIVTQLNEFKSKVVLEIKFDRNFVQGASISCICVD